MVLAEEIEQAATPMAAIVVGRLIGAGKDDDAPRRRIHGGGLVVTGPIRSIRRPLLPCLLRWRSVRIDARFTNGLVTRRRLVHGLLD
jgi:hypothetical protein